jgi:hypothetical protein
VEVDLLLSEPERLSISERDQFHAQSGSIEGDGCVDASYRENEMVEMIDNKSHTPTLIARRRWRFSQSAKGPDGSIVRAFR